MITKQLLESKEYTFLKSNPHLGKHIILLGLSGSYSYGTNQEFSDIDIRGIALNRKSDLIGLTTFEQYVDDSTDTCIYSFNKMIQLLIQCNPNTIELLGLNQEHYLYLNSLGQELLDHRKLFLSQRAIQSFGGYAGAQLRRLQNALARDSFPQQEKEMHMYNSIKNAMYAFQGKYERFESGSIQLYVDDSLQSSMVKEMYLDVNLKHYPLRDYKNIWAEMHNIIKEYDKLGKRNRKKDDNHLNKHAMHLIRLFLMAIDILEKEEIQTYRGKEHELLMQIRNGKFQKEDGIFCSEFYDLLHEYEVRLEYAAKNTSLPVEPDLDQIEEMVMGMNERVVRDEI